ncbi:MAG: glycosyltransferase family 2 protein [Candidatus Woesearchaeota archaeon]
MKLVVTIPAFNEEQTIGKVIREIKESLGKTPYSFQILVVDDGSTDDTAKISKAAGAIVVSHPKNYGLAESFRTEVKTCIEMHADVIVHIDADGQYRPQEIPKLVKEIEHGYDLVLGSRFLGKIESMPLVKRLGNIAFSKVISNIAGLKITDAQTGFRAFKIAVAENIRLISDHTYTQEQIIRSVRHKFKVKEVPVYFAKRKDKSRLMRSPFEYAIKAWINIFRIYRDYEPLKFFGLFGAGFLVVALLGMLRLAYFYFTTGLVSHLPTMMLTVLFVTIGIFIWLFAFLADMQHK